MATGGGAWTQLRKPSRGQLLHQLSGATTSSMDSSDMRRNSGFTCSTADAEVDMLTADGSQALSRDGSQHIALSREGSKAASLARGGSSIAEFAAEADEDADVPPAAAPRPLLAGGHGWVLSGSFTQPLVGHLGDQEIKFDKLLGAGSHGRVFAASWEGRDVAVKVMAHDGAGISGSEQQVQALVALAHPNVARTYMAVTYRRDGTSTAVGVTPGAAAAVAGTAAAQMHRQQQQQQGGGGGMCSGGGSSALDADVAPKGRRDSSSSTASRDQHAMLLGSTPPSTPCAAAAAAAEAETWVVGERCDLGSLESAALEWHITGEGDAQMFERLSVLVDAAQGLKVLHARGLLHGDLNARNVLLASNRGARVGMTGKLTDMALAASISAGRRMHTVRGLSHLAPEVQRRQGEGRSAASDIYAFGIMMWEAYTAQAAYRKLLDAAHLYEAIVLQNLRPKIPTGMPADYQLLMERCWASDPADRPSLDKVIGCLKVMAAERQRRLFPDQELPPPATAAAAAAVAAAAARAEHLHRTAPLPHSLSCDQATLMHLVQQHHQQQQQVPGGLPLSRLAAGASRLGAAPPPGMPGSLLHHKSCPATTFDALLRSGAVLSACASSDTSSTGKLDGDAELADAGPLLDDEEAAEAAALLTRAGSLARSGPGSAPVMHHSVQPGQRFSDGMDAAPDMDAAQNWVI